MKIVNVDRESWDPCLVPQWSVKLLNVIQFAVAFGEVYVLIQWMNGSPKPNLCSELNKKVQLTWLNAFSVYTMIVLSFFFLYDFNKTKQYSYIIWGMSDKPVRSGCMKVEMTVFNLMARAFVMIFMSVFITDEGW